MGNIINLPNCASPDTVFNTGVPLCDVFKKKIMGIIFLDKGVSFPKASITSIAVFMAMLKTATTAARGARIYPIWDLLDFTDNTGQPATGGVGNLSTATIITNDAVPAFSFGYVGGELRHKRMAAIAGGSYDVMFVDKGYVVYGTDEGDNFAGFSVLQSYVDISKFIVADAVNQYAFRVTLSNISQYRELSDFVVMNAGIVGLQGLISINNVLNGVFNAATFTVKPISDGGSPLQTIYGATLANASLWSIKKADGTVITVTAVANNVGAQGYDLTMGGTDFSSLAIGDQIRVNQSLAATLSAAGVKPYEGVESVFNKTA